MIGNTFLRWLRQLKRLPMGQGQALRKRTLKHRFRPQLDGLETRVIPATISPAQLRAAYGIDQVKFGAAGVVGNGAGQTIALVELGTDASLTSDLQFFDRQLFGSGPDGAQLLDTFGSYTGPVAGSTRPWFDILQDTNPSFPPSVGTSKQDVEADIDVEWAHVIAPLANILVVQTGSVQSGTAFAAAQTQRGVSVVASSFSRFPIFHPEDYSQPSVAFVGITGDTGASISSQLAGFTNDNYPASSPLVIAVGGTTLTLNADGSYGSETGWGFAGPDRFLPSSSAFYFASSPTQQPWNSTPGGFLGLDFTTSNAIAGLNNTATWTTTVTASDTLGKNDSGLEVSATWPASPSNTDQAQYMVSVNGSVVDTVTVNQRLAPNGTTGTQGSRTATFQELCALTKVAVGDTISVVLLGQAGHGTLVADTIGLGPDDASGGGRSNEPQPSYQNGLVIHDGSSILSSGGARTNPDVAFDGDYINSPVEFYDQGSSVIDGKPPLRLGAGTSLGSPAWAGLIAIADQGLAMVGQPALSTATALAGLYKLPSFDFHDETGGYNGYSAGPGYDLVTGLGSPVANQLILGLDNTVAPVSGPLTYEAPEGPAVNNLAVILDGANIEILNHFQVVASAPLAETTAVNILGANNTTNTLTINFGPVSNFHGTPTGPTGVPVTFDGGSLGGGSGTLILQGGAFTTEVDTATGPHSGTITLDNTSITYQDLAPIIDTTAASTFTIKDPMAGDHVTVQNDPHSPETGIPTSEIKGSGFEKIDFANKTNVNFTDTSGVGSDTFNIIDPLVNNAHFAEPNPGYVAEIFRVLLHRNAEPGTLAFFTAFLDHGGTRRAFVEQIENEPVFKEFRKVEVNDVYLALLHRPAEPQGLTGWANFLASGGTLDQLKAVILASPEYFIRRGGNTNDGFLDALFQDTLGRLIDPPTRAASDKYLASGGSRQLLALTVLQAREADLFAVRGYFQKYLGRPADSGGLIFGTNLLQAGLTDEAFIGILLESDEFFARGNNQ